MIADSPTDLSRTAEVKIVEMYKWTVVENVLIIVCHQNVLRALNFVGTSRTNIVPQDVRYKQIEVNKPDVTVCLLMLEA